MRTSASGAWLLPVGIAVAAASAVAIMGATITEIGPWYLSLRQPAWAPPNAAYPIAWTLIYALTAMSAVAGWSAARGAREAEGLIGLFALNGFLNILWSLLFFRAHRPDWAAAGAIALWLSVLALILAMRGRSRAGTLLLLPYLAWVSLAFALNLAVVRLNGPFG